MHDAPDATLIEKIVTSIIAAILLAYAALGIMQGEIPALPGRGTSSSGLFLLRGLAAYLYCAGLIAGAIAAASWIHPCLNARLNWLYFLLATCVIAAAIIQLESTA